MRTRVKAERVGGRIGVTGKMGMTGKMGVTGRRSPRMTITGKERWRGGTATGKTRRRIRGW